MNIREIPLSNKKTFKPVRGYLVKTKTGKIGKVNQGEKAINGKLPVYLADSFQTTLPGVDPVPISFEGGRLLCDPDSLTIIGYLDKYGDLSHERVKRRNTGKIIFNLKSS